MGQNTRPYATRRPSPTPQRQGQAGPLAEGLAPRRESASSNEPLWRSGLIPDAAVTPPSIPPAASPYIAHDLMETDAARTGKDQGRATRDAGSGRPQYPARNRTEAFAQAKEGAPLAWPPLARSDSRRVAPSPASSRARSVFRPIPENSSQPRR